MRHVTEIAALVVLGASGIPGAAMAQQRQVSRSSLPATLQLAQKRGGLRLIGPARALAVEPQAHQIAMPQQNLLAARVAEAPRKEVRPGHLGMLSGGTRADTVTVLPYYYLGVAQSGETMHLRPLVFTETPLRYDQQRGVFRGSLLVLLEDSVAPERYEELPTTIDMAVATPQIDSIAPLELTLTHTNLPATRITVFGRTPWDSVSVQLVPAFDPRGVTVWVPVRPTLVLQKAPARVAGFGLKTVPISVMLQGKSLGDKDSLSITLTTDRGTLVRNQLTIGKGGAVVARLRSEGIGTANLTAFGQGVDSAEESIRFTWPIAFLLAALIGGAVGGIVPQVSKARRKTSLLRPALAGMLIGFVVALVYYAVGLNLLAAKIDVEYSDEAAVLALAILGGAFGIAGIARLPAAKKLLRTAGARDP